MNEVMRALFLQEINEVVSAKIYIFVYPCRSQQYWARNQHVFVLVELIVLYVTMCIYLKQTEGKQKGLQRMQKSIQGNEGSTNAGLDPGYQYPGYQPWNTQPSPSSDD